MTTHEQQAKRTAEADACVRFIIQRENAGGQVMGMLNLRDYFAAKAMQGFAADPNASWAGGISGMAECAYQWADAMLKAREEQ